MTTRLMQNVRSGKRAVYDAELVAGGNWTEVVEEQKEPVDAPQEIPQFVSKPVKAPKKTAIQKAEVTEPTDVATEGDSDESQPAQT